MHQSSDRAQGLEPVLMLSIGARVMLRENLWVRGGLVNGATGTVRAILYPSNAHSHELPLCVMVEFDHYQGNTFCGRLFPIVPVTVTWNTNGAHCTRTQIPLTLAFAISIHKCQGLIVDKAIIDIGKSEFAAGLAYNALSRARKLADIILSPMYPKKDTTLFLAQRLTLLSISSFHGWNPSAEAQYDTSMPNIIWGLIVM